MRFFHRSRNSGASRFKKRVSSSDIASGRRKERLCVERIKEIHHLIMEKSGNSETFGFEDVVYSEGVLQGICQIGDWINDPFLYAAEAMQRIATMHPFMDGNKRTAFVVASTILAQRGIRLEDSENVVDFVFQVAMGNIQTEEIAHWLKSRSNHSPRRAMT